MLPLAACPLRCNPSFLLRISPPAHLLVMPTIMNEPSQLSLPAAMPREWRQHHARNIAATAACAHSALTCCPANPGRSNASRNQSTIGAMGAACSSNACLLRQARFAPRGLHCGQTLHALASLRRYSSQQPATEQDHDLFSRLLRIVLVGSVAAACWLNAKGFYGSVQGVPTIDQWQIKGAHFASSHVCSIRRTVQLQYLALPAS